MARLAAVLGAGVDPYPVHDVLALVDEGGGGGPVRGYLPQCAGTAQVRSEEPGRQADGEVTGSLSSDKAELHRRPALVRCLRKCPGMQGFIPAQAGITANAEVGRREHGLGDGAFRFLVCGGRKDGELQVSIQSQQLGVGGRAPDIVRQPLRRGVQLQFHRFILQAVADGPGWIGADPIDGPARSGAALFRDDALIHHHVRNGPAVVLPLSIRPGGVPEHG